MRVTSGILKNRRLTAPAALKDVKLRPTTDKVRQALFSSLGDISGCRFIDLFAGTGAVGIEAYSRGAEFITFVEQSPESIKKNLELLPGNVYRLIAGDVFLSTLNGGCDILFMDPPYETYLPDTLVELASNIVAPRGLIVYELSRRNLPRMLPNCVKLDKLRLYGDTALLYLIRA
jgi:16S rRNA (guanine966-N2)-methyltransferase